VTAGDLALADSVHAHGTHQVVDGAGGDALDLTERGMPTPREGRAWTHTTVARLLARVAV